MSDKSKDLQVEHLIDENLRRAYQSKVKEDLPDRLLDLVEKLRNASDGDEAKPEE